MNEEIDDIALQLRIMENIIEFTDINSTSYYFRHLNNTYTIVDLYPFLSWDELLYQYKQIRNNQLKYKDFDESNMKTIVRKYNNNIVSYGIVYIKNINACEHSFNPKDIIEKHESDMIYKLTHATKEQRDLYIESGIHPTIVKIEESAFAIDKLGNPNTETMYKPDSMKQAGIPKYSTYLKVKIKNDMLEKEDVDKINEEMTINCVRSISIKEKRCV